MKKSDPARIRSLAELRLHRQELELEILKTELNIRSDARNLRDDLSPVNLIRTLSKEISTTGIVSSAISLGKRIFSRRKNKEKGQEEENA